nr:uncharacterized protein LOC111429474 [Onthophagus taurus]
MEQLRLPAPLSFEGDIVENFRKFKQSFEIYLIASGKNEKASEFKVALLLNLMGEEGLEVYNALDLTAEQKKSYDTVLEELQRFMSPKTNEVYERFVFYKRKQEEGESFDHFLTDLKKLVKTCNYVGDTDSMVRYRIVLGIRNPALQEKLLHIDNLDLKKTVEICKASEATEIRFRNVQERSDKVEVVKRRIHYRKTENQDGKKENKNEFNCKRCGLKHKFKECPAYGRKCKLCDKYGHYAKMCNKNQNLKKVKDIKEDREDDSNSENDEDQAYVSSILVHEVNHRSEWTEVLYVEDKKVKFKIDTGSQVNIISLEVINDLGKQTEIVNTKTILETYVGFKIKPVSTVRIDCVWKNKNYRLSFIVVKEALMPILGLDACLDLSIMKNVSNVIEIKTAEQFVSKNIDVFTGLGQFKKECKLKLKQNVIPIVKPPRRVPLSIKPKLKKHLDSLVSRGIISKFNEPVEWLSNLVIVEKTDGSLRLCLDPKHLNILNDALEFRKTIL